MSMTKRLVLSALIGFSVALAAYFCSQEPGVKVDPSEILFQAGGVTGPVIIGVPPGSIDEISFFADVYMEPNTGNPVSRILLNHPATDVSFWVRPSGDLGIQWGKRNLHASRADKWFPKAKIRPGQWNKAGFIYKKKPGTLTTYINGKPCWKTTVEPVNRFPGNHFEFLPQSPNTEGETPCVSTAASPVLVKKALTAHHLLDLHRDFRFYRNLFLKVVVLFLLASLFVFLLWDGFRVSIMPGNWKYIWLFTAQYFVFLVFGFGQAAAGYIHAYANNHPLLNHSSYFDFVLIMGLMLPGAIAVSRWTRTAFNKNMLYFGGVTALLLFAITLSLLPRSPLTAPFVFNILYSLVFSFFAGAPFLLSQIAGDHVSPGEAADGK